MLFAFETLVALALFLQSESKGSLPNGAEPAVCPLFGQLPAGLGSAPSCRLIHDFCDLIPAVIRGSAPSERPLMRKQAWDCRRGELLQFVLKAGMKMSNHYIHPHLCYSLSTRLIRGF